MAYITDKKLGSVIDVPICLPAVELLQGDWLAVACFKLVAPMKLTYQHLTAQIIAMTGHKLNTTDLPLTPASITADNKISANLGLAFVSLHFGYPSAHPSQSFSESVSAGQGALDSLVLTTTSPTRRSASPIIRSEPGTYYIMIASNMKPDAESTRIVPMDVSIDMKVMLTGSIRLELHPA